MQERRHVLGLEEVFGGKKQHCYRTREDDVQIRVGTAENFNGKRNVAIVFDIAFDAFVHMRDAIGEEFGIHV